MITVRDIYNEIDRLVPFDTKESWDNCGLLAGDPDMGVTRVITALDITKDVINEAFSKNAELIVSHHPIIFSPLKSVSAASPVGMLLSRDISAICTHTPFDMAECGMNKGLYDILAKPLGLKEQSEPLEDMGEGRSIGRIYDLEMPLTAEEAAKRAKEALGCGCVRLCGDKLIKRLAISSGSGNSMTGLALKKGADGIISGDFKHDVFIDYGLNDGLVLIDCGHFNTEKIFCKIMKDILTDAFEELEVIEAESCINPVRYI